MKLEVIVPVRFMQYVNHTGSFHIDRYFSDVNKTLSDIKSIFGDDAFKFEIVFRNGEHNTGSSHLLYGGSFIRIIYDNPDKTILLKLAYGNDIIISDLVP